MTEEKGTIIQITQIEHKWFPCLLVVDEVKVWGVQAYVSVPEKGAAYLRLKTSDYEIVGKAVVIAQ